MDDATNSVFVWAGRTSKPYQGFKENRQIQFKNDDLELLKKEFGDKIEYLSPRIYKNVNVRYKNESGSYSARAVMPDHQFLENTMITKGRYINNEDIKNKYRYAVIGRLVEKDIYRNEDALGTFINLNGLAYMVIGVFEDRMNCNAAAEGWMSRQVAGNPVYAECEEWDGVDPPRTDASGLLIRPGAD